ncbi:MAG: CBS domain-containing protein [Candidatus Micrarchaeota archaeon]|nr:CBS domain-containing protein [Candidatus Micrarchaeota archaeon]
MDDLRLIREMRRRLGMTQAQLAKRAGVSQSLVAKIESGEVDPAYSKARAIMDALQREQLSKEKTAGEIMHRGVHAVSPSQTLHEAAELMRKKGISQLAVIEGGRMVGSISEQLLILRMAEGKKSISKTPVREAMDEPFPTALASTPFSAIASLLRHCPAVLIIEKGEIAGIITKADLLKCI